jgi:uncharacterized membrane protein (UPF0136 family)
MPPTSTDPVYGQILLVVYAILLGVGGAIGYFRAGSVRSLQAGLACAAILLAIAVASSRFPRPAFLAAMVVLLGLLYMFVARFQITRRFMPSGLMALASLLGIAILGALYLSK